jgi:PilZ domain
VSLTQSFNVSWQVFPIHLASKYLKAFPAVSLPSGRKQEERSLDDRRKETRRRFSAFTPVYDLYPRTLLGYLGDLHMRGALVIGKNLITINKETILEIIFPGELADITVVPVTIPARIAWCRADEPSQSYSIGVEFTELTPLHKDIIQQILTRYHFSYTLSDADFDQER